jgi:glycosyltransferase involved in cell wall biosynthesis
MGNTLSIDVVIVTRNRPEKLFRAVSSLLAGAMLPKSLIIIDSSDHQRFSFYDYILRLCRKHKVKLIYKSNVTPGISSQRNYGIELSTGDIIAFLDDDEIPPVEWITTIKTVFMRNPKSVVITGSRRAYYPDNYWNKVWETILYYELHEKGYRSFMFASNTCYRRGFLKKYKLQFDNKMRTSSEDVCMAYKIRNTGNMIYADPALYVYHDFRTSGFSFFTQWYGYGFGTSEFHFYHVIKERFGFKNIKKLLGALYKSTQWSWQFSDIPISIKSGLVFRDCGFLIGYCVGLVSVLTHRKAAG